MLKKADKIFRRQKKLMSRMFSLVVNHKPTIAGSALLIARLVGKAAELHTLADKRRSLEKI